MCGIYGLFLERPLTDEDIEAARDSARSLSHRGPDGFGEWVDRDAGVYLGHNRLAILDPQPRSDQPMVRDGNVLIFNGEIYNYRELRDRLVEDGASFETTGDAEVLLEAWRHWGPGTLDRLEGMFAAAVWDGEKGHLFVDPFGEKPLYWAQLPDGIACASELTPLTEAAGAQGSLAEDRMPAYLSLGYVPAPKTAFDRIHRLPQASYLQVQGGVARPEDRYWTPPTPPRPAEHPDRLDETDLDVLKDALVGSLRRRLHSDVPMCLFLSSGVDSALVASLAKVELGAAPPCITVAFRRGHSVNEAPRAAEIARYLDLDHKVVESTEDPEVASPEQVLTTFGQPNDNITSISIRQMTAVARDLGYKTALTGMGGDEVFYGYQKHAFINRYRRLYDLPETVRVLLGNLARLVPGRGKHQQFADLVGVHDHEVYLARKNYPAIDRIREVPGFQGWANREFTDLAPPFDVSVPRYELEEVMPNSHLLALDHGSMRNGFELRTPYLSREVVEAVRSFDPRAFMAFGQKSVLRRLLRRYLPDDLVDQPKRGFTFPMERFAEQHREPIQHLDSVPEELVEAAFDQEAEDPVWRRLAVRIVLAEAFLQRTISR